MNHLLSRLLTHERQGTTEGATVKLLGALGLLLALLAAAITIVVQSLLLLAFANDAAPSADRETNRPGQGLIGLLVGSLGIGVILPPVLFWWDVNWIAILLPAAVAFGATLIAVLSIAIQSAK